MENHRKWRKISESRKAWKTRKGTQGQARLCSPGSPLIPSLRDNGGLCQTTAAKVPCLSAHEPTEGPSCEYPFHSQEPRISLITVFLSGSMPCHCRHLAWHILGLGSVSQNQRESNLREGFPGRAKYVDLGRKVPGIKSLCHSLLPVTPDKSLNVSIPHLSTRVRAVVSELLSIKL